jgi:hypothetical protein
MCELCNAVTAVREAEARIWFTPRKGTTFYSGNDIWLYDPREDSITCEICRNIADQASAAGGFNGNTIRALFPWHVILGPNTIGGPGEGGRGLSHPWCRCRLNRYLDDPADRVPAQHHLVPKKLEPEKKIEVLPRPEKK